MMHLELTAQSQGAHSHLCSTRNACRKLEGGHICGELPDIPSKDKYDLLTMRFTARGYWFFTTRAAHPVSIVGYPANMTWKGLAEPNAYSLDHISAHRTRKSCWTNYNPRLAHIAMHLRGSMPRPVYQEVRPDLLQSHSRILLCLRTTT